MARRQGGRPIGRKRNADRPSRPPRRPSAPLCCGPPAHRRRRPRRWPSAASTPIWPATTRTASSPSRPTSTASRPATSCPARKWTIVQESPATTVIDGHWGFGFHVNAKAMQLTIDKAKTTNVAACTVFRQSHVGRLAAYPLMAAKEGMIGLATADSAGRPRSWRRSAAARRGSAPIRSRLPCRPTSRRRSISTWRPRRWRPAR